MPFNNWKRRSGRLDDPDNDNRKTQKQAYWEQRNQQHARQRPAGYDAKKHNCATVTFTDGHQRTFLVSNRRALTVGDYNAFVRKAGRDNTGRQRIVESVEVW